MTQDTTFDYTWDAENRLHSVQTRLALGANPTGPDSGDKYLEFKYDYMGRRVEKTYQVYNGSAWVVQSGFPQRYVYDGWTLDTMPGAEPGGRSAIGPSRAAASQGWKVVLTLNGASSNAIVRKSTWGLDLSGTLQGAGGIGGLLAKAEGSSACWYFYDGNGNVTEVIQPVSGGGTILLSMGGTGEADSLAAGTLTDETTGETPVDELLGLDAVDLLGGVMAAAAGGGGGTTTCTLLAHYEYDPYGNVLYSTGTYAATNPFRFSTKWCDYELGSGKELYYYGYRYYSPRLGRWLSRDPIGERGGLNLYVFVKNTPANSVDPRGLRIRHADCIDAYNSANMSAEARNVITSIRNLGCSAPRFSCSCYCAPRVKGETSIDGRTITLCSNNFENGMDLQGTIMHELRHVYQFCEKPGWDWTDGNEVACQEVQAQWCAGKCDPPHGIYIQGNETKRNCVLREAQGSVIARGFRGNAAALVAAALANPDCTACEGQAVPEPPPPPPAGPDEPPFVPIGI